MQQRARRRDPQPFAQCRLKGAQCLQRGLQIGAPHIATVDDARREHPVRRQRVAPDVELLRRPHQIDVHAIDRQRRQRGRGEGDRFEVSGQQQLGTAGTGLRRQGGVERGERIAPGRLEFEGERRFIELHPFHAQLGQPRQHPGIGPAERGHQTQAIEARYVRFGQPQKSQRPDQYGLGRVARLLRFAHAVEQPLRTGLKRGVGVKLGDEVVIVGVEPFGHLHRGLRGVAAGQFEGLLQAQAGGVESEARGQGAQQCGGVEHVVVQGEITHRDKARTGVTLSAPVVGAQLRRGGLQLGRSLAALPKRFERKLQFALRADAGVAQNVGGGHADSSLVNKSRAAVSATRQHESSDEFLGYAEFNSS